MSAHHSAHQADAVAAPAWRTRFEALVRARMTSPFDWGVHDCCLWAADATAAITGHDHAAAWRGTYSTAAQAARLLHQLGGIHALAALAGPPCAPLRAGVGDVGLVQSGGQDLLAVCTGTHWLVPGTNGLAAHPLDAACAAWKVPRA